jgi:F420-dependent oxidoreductase-like protein
MRFVLWIGTEQPWQDVRQTAGLAETAGWDGVYLADHFMPNEEPAGLQPRLEAWTTLAALAAVTNRLRLGVLVSGNTYRHPAILAKMAATADRVSGGRLVLGLGAGWQVSEHRAYGLELPEIPERLARLEEACEVVRLLLTRERSDFEGSYYRLADAPCEPKPLQSPLPLLLGVSGERIAMGLAARFADIWNCWGTPELISHKISVLERHCEAIGRDPATIERSAQALVMMSEDPEQLATWRAEAGANHVLVGSPEQISEQLGAYERIGLNEFVVSDRTLGGALSRRHETMTRFLQEVAAPFRS